jgi:hypothetical protein
VGGCEQTAAGWEKIDTRRRELTMGDIAVGHPADKMVMLFLIL